MWRASLNTLLCLLTRKYSVISAHYVFFFQWKTPQACLILNKRFSKEICNEVSSVYNDFQLFLFNWWHFTANPFKTSLSPIPPSRLLISLLITPVTYKAAFMRYRKTNRQTESIRLLWYFLVSLPDLSHGSVVKVEVTEVQLLQGYLTQLRAAVIILYLIWATGVS